MASRSDELVTRILAALERLPDDRAQRLVDEAWEQAEDAVREVLSTAMRAALLRRTAAVLEAPVVPEGPRPAEPAADGPPPRPAPAEPPPAEPDPPTRSATPAAADVEPPAAVSDEAGLACYVYGIIPAGGLALTGDLPGVDPDAPVEIVSRNGLGALTSRVRTDEFGPEALRERLADRGWLEEKVRLHEEVLEHGMQARALVPMRFCTIVRSAEDLAEFLDEHEVSLRRGLSDLAGKREWGVKVLTVPDRFDEHVRAVSDDVRALDEQVGRTGSGQAYFLTKRRQQRVEAESEQIAWAWAAECHDRLQAVAVRAAALDPRREAEGSGGWMILNGAYLVDDERLDAFAAVVDERAEEAAASGLEVQLTGPWPAYSFVEPELAADVG